MVGRVAERVSTLDGVLKVHDFAFLVTVTVEPKRYRSVRRKVRDMIETIIVSYGLYPAPEITVQ